MAWVRFPTWDRWKEVTQFRTACEAALAAEHARWASLPIDNPDTVLVKDPVQGGSFTCSLSEYKQAINNTNLLYSMLLASYAGLIEEHGRNLIEYAITTKNIQRAAFPNLHASDPIEEAAENYIRSAPIEAWGTKFLALKGWGWSDVDGGQAGVVEAIAIRNLTAHGLTEVNTTAFNRMMAAGCPSSLWSIGQRVSLDRSTFERLLQSLRAFGRKLSDCAAIL